MKFSSRTVLYLIVFLGLSQQPAALDRDLKPEEISKLQENIKNNPGNTKSRRFLGAHYYRNENWSKVIHYLRPVTEKLPESSLLHLAQAYLNTNDTVSAEAVSQIMLSKKSLSPKSVKMRVQVVSEQLRHMSPAEADKRNRKIMRVTEMLKKAQKSNRSRSLYDLHLEFLEEFVDNYAYEGLLVLADLKKHLGLQDRHYSKYCQYNYEANYTHKALEYCALAVKKDPDNHQNLIRMGRVHVNIGNQSMGRRVLASVGRRYSSNEEALRATADYYYENKNISEAYQYYKKATQQKNADPAAYLGLGKTAFELKKYQEALQAFLTHCQMAEAAHQEFRKASGLLKDHPAWYKTYRQKMHSCNAF